MVKHNLQFHIEDPLYFALLRKKAEYNCKTWIQFLYTISNLPVLSRQSEEDKVKCEILYEVLNKTKSPELKAKCQNKVQSIINGRDTKPTLDELINKRDELLEFINSDIDEKHRKRGLKMLVFFNQIIEEEQKTAHKGII